MMLEWQTIGAGTETGKGKKEKKKKKQAQEKKLRARQDVQSSPLIELPKSLMNFFIPA